MTRLDLHSTKRPSTARFPSTILCEITSPHGKIGDRPYPTRFTLDTLKSGFDQTPSGSEHNGPANCVAKAALCNMNFIWA
ncbi:unnamed protein product [Brassica rapa]|uniref:Uncharacterized protein n=1 Tax=Brassica campestris TaxID=3711 RepID=A0A8D9CPS7_BRACM|nr:unnamed protein product [Brassica rapa]